MVEKVIKGRKVPGKCISVVLKDSTLPELHSYFMALEHTISGFYSILPDTALTASAASTTPYKPRAMNHMYSLIQLTIIWLNALI